jgi:hypothetical protein
LEEAAAQYGEALYDPQGEVFAKLYLEDRGLVSTIADKLTALADRLGLLGKSRRVKRIVRDLHERAMAVMREQLMSDLGPPLYDPLLTSRDDPDAPPPARADLVSRRMVDKLDRRVLGPMRERLNQRRSEILRRQPNNAAALREIELDEVRLAEAQARAVAAGDLAAAELTDPELVNDVRYLLAPLPGPREDLHTKSRRRMAKHIFGRILGRWKWSSPLMRETYARGNSPENIARDNQVARPVWNAGIQRRSAIMAVSGALTRDARALYTASGKTYDQIGEILHTYDELGATIPAPVLAALPPKVREGVEAFRAAVSDSMKHKAEAWRVKLGVSQLSPDPLDSAPYQNEIDAWTNDLTLAKAAVKSATSPMDTALARAEVAKLAARKSEIKAMGMLVHIQEIMQDSAREGYVPHYWTEKYLTVLAFDSKTGEVLERRSVGSELEATKVSDELADKYPGMNIRTKPAETDSWLPEVGGKQATTAREKIRGLLASDPNIGLALFGNTPEGKQEANDFLAKIGKPLARSNTKGYERDIKHILSRHIQGAASFAANATFDHAVHTHLDAWSGKDSINYRNEMAALKTEMIGIEAMRTTGALTPAEYQKLTEANKQAQILVESSYADLPHMRQYWAAWAAAERASGAGFLDRFTNRANNLAANVYIGLNQITALLNLTQMAATGLPIASALGGTQGAKEIGKAHTHIWEFAKAVVKPWRDSQEMVIAYANNVRASNPQLAKAMDAAVNEATVFDVPKDSEFQSALRTPDPGERGVATQAEGVLWYSFNRGEVANRMMAYVAGFKLATELQATAGFWKRADAMGYAGPPTPEGFAPWFTRQVNFIMGDINRPMGMRGGMKLLTSLKSYPINILMLRNRMMNAAQDLSGADKARLHAGWVGMTLGNAMVGGLIGSSITLTLLRALIEQGIRLKEDKNVAPFDVDTWLRKNLGANSRVADFLTRGGLAAAGVPVGSLPSRMSNFTGLLPDKFAEAGTVAASASAALRMVESANKIWEIARSEKPGEQKVVESLLSLPLAALGGLKAAYTVDAYGNPGLTTKAGRTIAPAEALDGTDKWLLRLGIRSEKITDLQDKDQIISSYEAANKLVTKHFTTALTDAVMEKRLGRDGGQAALDAVLVKLQAYEKAHMSQPELLVLPNIKRAVEQLALGRILGTTHLKFVEAAARPAVLTYENANK